MWVPWPCESARQVLAVARRVQRSPAQAVSHAKAGHGPQVLIRWALQLGLVVTFRSERCGRRCMWSFPGGQEGTHHREPGGPGR